MQKFQMVTDAPEGKNALRARGVNVLDLKLIHFIIGKGSNIQKMLENQSMFLKKSGQFNCSGQTRDS